MTVLFAKPRHEYASYADWHELIRLSEYDEIYIDEIPHEGVKDNVYICTPLNGEWENGIQTDARVIHWCLEYWREAPRPIPGVEHWHMDAWQAETYNVKYVQVGSHPGLRPTANSTWQERYDIAFIGYINGVHRRERLRRDLQQRGVTMSPTGAWGDERHKVLSNSTAYLHVHQWDDIPAVPALRLVVAAAYSLPVILERCNDYGVFRSPPGFPGFISMLYEQMPDTIPAHYLQAWNKSHLDEVGDGLHQFLCHDLTFRKSVETAL